MSKTKIKILKEIIMSNYIKNRDQIVNEIRSKHVILYPDGKERSLDVKDMIKMDGTLP